MEKIWLRSYPQNVPISIDPNAYASLTELFEESCGKYRTMPAYANFGTTLTYADLDELTQQFAAFLQQKLQLKKGERLAIMLPNVLQYPISIFAAFRAGLVVVNVNPLYTARELAHQLKDSGAKAIVVLANFAHVLERVLPETAIEHVIVTELGDLFSFFRRHLFNFAVKYIKKMVPAWHIANTHSFRSALAKGATSNLQAVPLNGDDIAFLQYTGGTTGVAKGAILTHRNMVANVMQASTWIAPFIGIAHEIIITALPLYHIFSLLANCLTFIKIGAFNVLITNPRDFKTFMKELRRVKFTAITGVNTLFNALLNQPEFATIDFSKLHFTLGGGMAVQEVVARHWHAVTGTALLEAYGLTETSPAVCIAPGYLTEYNGSVGLPLASTEIMIRDEQGNALPPNQSGEVCIKGPQVTQGYWNMPEETKRIFTEDGWLLTGDIGKMDERGFLYIVDRKKDMIIVSGFNVYPNEVEAVIAAHPGVREVAIVGIPSATTGEQIKAFIVPKDPQLTSERLLAYCRENLTGYKVPKQFEFRTDLPKSNVGKILRRDLRDEERAKLKVATA